MGALHVVAVDKIRIKIRLSQSTRKKVVFAMTRAVFVRYVCIIETQTKPKHLISWKQQQKPPSP